MAVISPYSQYEATKVLTSSSLEHIILLYKRSINLLEEAIEKLQEGDNLSFSENISKTCRIIQYLMSILDLEQGGIIAENLAKLYDYSLFTLTTSNINNDKSGVEEVKGILIGLLDGWEGIREWARENS